MKKVKVKIKAEVTTTVELQEGETVDTVKDRFVDIYLHSAGEEGYSDKEDLGASFHEIEVL